MWNALLLALVGLGTATAVYSAVQIDRIEKEAGKDKASYVPSIRKRHAKLTAAMWSGGFVFLASGAGLGWLNINSGPDDPTAYLEKRYGIHVLDYDQSGHPEVEYTLRGGSVTFVCVGRVLGYPGAPEKALLLKPIDPAQSPRCAAVN